MAGAEPVSIGTLDIQRITNIHHIVGIINQSITLIQNTGNEDMAVALKEITQTIVMTSRLEKHVRQTTIEILRTLAWEASLPPAERQLGIVKAALAYIPLLLSASPDILNRFQPHLGHLRKFFDIPE